MQSCQPEREIGSQRPSTAGENLGLASPALNYEASRAEPSFLYAVFLVWADAQSKLMEAAALRSDTVFCSWAAVWKQWIRAVRVGMYVRVEYA